MSPQAFLKKSQSELIPQTRYAHDQHRYRQQKYFLICGVRSDGLSHESSDLWGLPLQVPDKSSQKLSAVSVYARDLCDSHGGLRDPQQIRVYGTAVVILGSQQDSLRCVQVTLSLHKMIRAAGQCSPCETRVATRYTLTGQGDSLGLRSDPFSSSMVVTLRALFRCSLGLLSPSCSAWRSHSLMASRGEMCPSPVDGILTGTACKFRNVVVTSTPTKYWVSS